MSELFKLSKSDFVKGLITAVLSAVFLSAGQMLQSPDFNFAAIDWQAILNVAGATFLAYTSKNFLTSNDGRILGKFQL